MTQCTPHYIDTDHRSAKITPFAILPVFLIGFFAILNFPLTPSSEKSVRVLDLIGILALLILFKALFRVKFPLRAWSISMVIAMAIVVPLISAWTEGEQSRVFVIIRLIFSVATGIIFAQYTVRNRQERVLALGFWFGSMSGLLIALGQGMGVIWLLNLMPLDRADSWVLYQFRPSGIWGHPNTAGQVTMAGAAMLFLFCSRTKRNILIPALAYLMIAILNYTIIQNRAPLVVGLFIASIMVLRYGSSWSRLITVSCILAISTIILISPTTLLGERWTGNFGGVSTSEQALDRMRSTLAGVKISLEAPFGQSEYRRSNRMITETGIKAAHNGFVHSSLTIGPVPTILLICIFLSALCFRWQSSSKVNAISAGSICLLLMFEDALLDPSIVLTLAILASIQVYTSRGVSI